MAEIFSIATAAAGALEQSIQLFSRFRQAARRQKGLPELVEKYLAEVSQAKKIVELAASEEGLKTPNVGACIAKLAAAGEVLHGHLEQMEKASAKGPVRGFVNQLVSGKSDQEKLGSIMRDVGNAKQDLGMYIQLANVGLTRAVGDTIRVNTMAVEAVNKQLAETLGPVYSLKIGQMIEGRPRDADGTVALTEDDVASLSRQQETPPAVNETDAPNRAGNQASRVIRGNEAADYALQVNTPIGVDVWKDMASVTIENNKAMGHANQWNYPMASVDAFLAALEMRRPSGPDGQGPAR
ncbi:hypothetical protein MAPG_03108 [Magnaporthiopsis poae ATCC 64411]|uniref:NACHT-NTPase and P-loop NTPases N-terminal domain-containing protein n=1 Tax=Magnaporthiopsis poae (strain ATCC 64411 / 73-15) TaxID=644358 RepID=A0A0C4DT51_MAGP6|nr:hypothetical protein MAPG_03108 [Magnaporthiopsis poae ATCC 64411]